MTSERILHPGALCFRSQIEAKEAEARGSPPTPVGHPTAGLHEQVLADLAAQFYATEQGDHVDRTFWEDTPGVIPDVSGAAVAADWVSVARLAADAALGQQGARLVDPIQVWVCRDRLVTPTPPPEWEYQCEKRIDLFSISGAVGRGRPSATAGYLPP
jgi:hypothetical protein